jgi:hypothetical protein
VSEIGASGPLDPERYDRWFERPWGRHAFAVERDALLAALEPLEGEELLDLAVAVTLLEFAGDPRRVVDEHAGRWAPGAGAFQFAVLDLPRPSR